ncbi:MAG: 50S ribosomal protein L23 [Parcubacteria group bacterium CG08_land_8_20_14_0_20_43_9]|nr:MAG: 50S ribosomal protein L23 [Parcubacteria group bacterium CG08_land_8_20_14_0_20_43_9]
MSIFDIFKKKVKPEAKKEEKKPEPAKKKEIKGPKIKVAPKAGKKPKKEAVKEEKAVAPEAKTAEKKIVKPRKEVKPTSLAWKALIKPHVTEKATYLAEKNEYVFVVSKKANKIEVRQAIRDIYDVDVEGVRMISIPGKKRRIGRVQGFKSGYKKAIVKIKQGQEIEVLPK